MDLETTQTNDAAKLPLLKKGEYEMCRLRIEQYFQIQDYALWDVIENVNSFKPTTRTTTNVDGTSTSMIPGAVTTEEKTQTKNDVKARSMLLMALPNEHLLTFNQYKDAKTLFDAIQTRFGGNDATKKTQKTLLKQMYENFNAPSTESLDSIFNRLQKIVSQLAILGENISQEDLNLKFLRSLPSEWNTHVVVWRNKPDLDSMSFDDLYNNFKIVEQEVKRTATSSTSSSSQNMAFVSSPSSINEVNTANVQVSTANSSVSTDSTLDSTANLSDATVYAFLANQPNGSQLVHEDLEQIHEDDLEEMDLKWQLALLSMRARRYYQRTGKKITINGSDTAGYDKSKVECFNCHKMGHFARECRSPRNQESRPRNHDNGNRNQDSSRRTVNVEETSSKAMVAIDGAGFDWSFMAEEEVTTNMALMAFSDSEVYNDKTCSNTCLKSFETLKTQLDNLRVEFNKSEFNLATYKRGLASVEEQLVFYKKNEVMFSDQIAVLKRDASFKDSEIIALKSEIEKLKKEKECNQIKIDKFENASNYLDKSIRSQISDNSRKGVGYNVVPPLPTGLFAPLTIDLSNSGLEEFQQPEFKGYGPKASKSVYVDTSNKVKKTPDTLLVKELMVNYNYTTKRTHPNAQRNIVPRAVLMKTGLKPFNTARTVNTTLPKYTIFSVNTARQKVVNTTRPKAINTARPNSVVVNTVRANQANAVKALICNPPTDDQGYVDSGCSRHMISNISYLSDFQEFEDMLPLVEDSKEERSLVKNNMYSVDMKNIVSKESLTCLVAKATLDESMLWHRRLGRVNFKTINKLVKDNLVRGLPSKRFENDQTCVSFLKGNQYKASYSLGCNNGTKFKNKVMNEFCEKKGIKREYSVARTPQQNGVAERRNRTLIEAAKTIGRTPTINFIRPFGSHVSILNTLDHLGKFDGKSDDGFFIGYSLTSTNSNDFAALEVSIGEGSTSMETDTSQDYIVMPLWKDSLLIDSLSMNVCHDEPELSCDVEKKDDEGVSKESGVDDQEKPESSTPNINTAGPSINTASANLKTGSLHINTVSPIVITTRSNRSQTISDIFSLRDNVTSKATHADLFGDETKMDMSNLNASYQVPTTPNTRIHIDHSLDHVIGDMQFGVQTRGMTKTANEQGFLSAVYEGKLMKTFILIWFEDPDYPDKVYKVVKAFYGLHQAPRAWYETLAKYLLDNGFYRGKIDQTLFIKKQKGDILLMSSMGELTFFLGLQMKQKEDGIFIIQDKYMTDILKKFGFQDVKTASTPMDIEKPPLKDSNGDDVDVYLYRLMIGSLMYLTSSRPDIIAPADQDPLGSIVIRMPDSGFIIGMSNMTSGMLMSNQKKGMGGVLYSLVAEQQVFGLSRVGTFERTFGLCPYHFTYPERRLTMEEILYKFIDEGKHEQEEMRAFIHEFKTTNELLFKERNNSLSELGFEVQGLLKVFNNTPMSNLEVKGVTTRGGKQRLKIPYQRPTQKTEKPIVQPTSELQTPPIPCPRRLRKEKEEAQQKKFLENLKQLHINLPFIEALAQMLKYAKFLKGLLTNRARLEEACTITMNERCSVLHTDNALANQEASISLMPYTMYEKLRLGEPKPTRMSLELADRLTRSLISLLKL
ncbi:putative ribonuclease H-like domain-containing protein [Tanacetum coccineum]